MPKQQNKTLAATICLFLTAVIWGFAFVAQVQGMEFMGSLTYGGVRFAMGTLSLLPVIFVFERKRADSRERRATLQYGTLAGVILFAASTLQQYGIQLTNSAGKSGFITGLYTVLVPVFSIALGKKPTLLTGLGAISAFAGLYFLSVPDLVSVSLRNTEDFRELVIGLSKDFGFTLGDGLLVIGAFFWTFHIMVVDAYAPKVRPIRFSAVQFAACAVLSLAGMALFEQPTLHAVGSGIVPLLYGGLLSVGVAYTLQIVGQRHVEPSKAAIIFSLESLFAAVGGFLLLHEMLGWKGYLGGGLMMLGIVLSQLKAKKRLL